MRTRHATGSTHQQLCPSKQPGHRLAGPRTSFDRPLRARRLIKTGIGARHAVVVHDAGIAEIVAPVGFIVMVVVMIVLVFVIVVIVVIVVMIVIMSIIF